MVMIGRALRAAVNPLGAATGLGVSYPLAQREAQLKKKEQEKQQQQQQQQQQRRQEINEQIKAADPYSDIDTFQQKQEQLASQMRNQANQARADAKQEAQEAFANPPPGLTPEQKRAMQTSAANQIGGQTQNYIRQIAGQQGARGVRGGAVAALQNEVAKSGQDALSDFNRKLSGLDADQSLRKLAAQFALQEGSAQQSALDHQAATDFIQGYLQNQLQRDLARRANEEFFYTI